MKTKMGLLSLPSFLSQEEDISVSMYHDVLTIKGEKKSKKEEKDERAII